jgi:signal transduction histidine kinase
VTDKRSRASADAPDVAREILRRAGHELRNALSGVSVNLEVVRSRTARDGGAGDVKSFAERAASQISEASALADGVLALTRALLVFSNAEGAKRPPSYGAGSQIELMIYGETADALLSDIKRLASRIDVEVEEHPRSVILKVYPQGTSHSKN